MTTTPKSIGEIVAEARAARAEGMAQAEEADATGWDRKVIDQAIDAFAETGRPFSANDLRELLPDVRPALIGSRFMAASAGGRIAKVGTVTSTKVNTHAKPVASWVGADHVPAADPTPATQQPAGPGSAARPALPAELRALALDDSTLWDAFPEDLITAVTASTLLTRLADHLEHHALQAAS